MPQMAPYNWLYLNLYFFIIFMLIMHYIHFFYLNKFLIINKSLTKKKNFMNKW